MLRFYAESFVSVMSEISRLSSSLLLASNLTFDGENAEDAELIEGERQDIQHALSGIDRQFRDLPFSRVVNSQYDHLRSRLAEPAWDRGEMSILFRVLHESIIADLKGHCFLVIPEENVELYAQPKPLFGEDVGRVFPEAIYDVEEGTRCLALEQWTAAVFHMMRVLEKGLRWLAAEVGATMEPEVELENWKVVIDQIEAKIRALENQQKSAAKSEKSQFYCEAATNFYYFKEAWRNHVSHSRATYDDRQAREIWGHVRSFMQRLAMQKP